MQIYPTDLLTYQLNCFAQRDNLKNALEELYQICDTQMLDVVN